MSVQPLFAESQFSARPPWQSNELMRSDAEAVATKAAKRYVTVGLGGSFSSVCPRAFGLAESQEKFISSVLGLVRRGSLILSVRIPEGPFKGHLERRQIREAIGEAAETVLA